MKEHLAEAKLSFIGCGVMAESIVAGLLKNKLVTSEQITVSHPREARRKELSAKYGIKALKENSAAAVESQTAADSVVVLCVKPQRLSGVLDDLKGFVTPDQLVLSIVAGAKIETIAEALGCERIARTMPNTPSQIGHGITAWTATEEAREKDSQKIRVLLTALGKELYVENENMIDMATSLSATGPTYVFMMMEALTDAGVHLGFSRDMSKELVQEMMLGSVLFAMESDLHPAELRNMVTSPGGTSADAIYQMEKGGLRTVLSKAVHSAYKKAVALGQK
ncbi:MAG: pyrroline-5-carboxylate reductase [Pyrinomonadaceae bacterium]